MSDKEVTWGDDRWWKYYQEPSGNGDCVFKAVDFGLSTGIGQGYADYSCRRREWRWPRHQKVWGLYALCEKRGRQAESRKASACINK